MLFQSIAVKLGNKQKMSTRVEVREVVVLEQEAGSGEELGVWQCLP